MLDRNLIRKLELEQPLNEAEAHLIDQHLADDRWPVLMREIPQDQVSMAWRSQLNERLLSLGARQKAASRWMGIWRPVMGLGLAGALALVFVSQRVPTHAQTPRKPANLEAALLEIHADSVSYTQIAGAGLAPHEAEPVRQSLPAEDIHWTSSDLEL